MPVAELRPLRGLPRPKPAGVVPQQPCLSVSQPGDSAPRAQEVPGGSTKGFDIDGRDIAKPMPKAPALAHFRQVLALKNEASVILSENSQDERALMLSFFPWVSACVHLLCEADTITCAVGPSPAGSQPPGPGQILGRFSSGYLQVLPEKPLYQPPAEKFLFQNNEGPRCPLPVQPGQDEASQAVSQPRLRLRAGGSSPVWCGSGLASDSSKKWTVTIPMGHVVATVGGQAELSCQLSPSQSAKHMEVSWFKGDYSKLVHRYSNGREVSVEAAPEYAGRTDFVKGAIGEGRVTLRLRNISISDNGPYQCAFKDSDFSDVASMNLTVTALGLETQIHIQAPRSDGLVVECNSGGWFPQPQMEWRDNKGEVVPHSSKSYSQDGAGLFHMKMTLVLRNKEQGNMTCYIFNPLSGEGKHINIILADALFQTVHIWMMFIISAFFMTLIFIGVCIVCKCPKIKVFQWDFIHCLNKSWAQLLYCVCFGTILRIYVIYRSRVSVSDPLFSLYNDWIFDIAMMAIILMTFYSLFILVLYWTVRGYIWKRITYGENWQRCNQRNVDMENMAQEMTQVLQ
ncbi:selection and upkeep of intraepithelial T-cells protein 7-like [Saccopteryx bilineata]|uniref:selection and upkeep of intraepithelial T-cells protein 7-like n=1 Tax=Saccopteryx bilineata TaxID=59482 RepID=UPI00338E5247